MLIVDVGDVSVHGLSIEDRSFDASSSIRDPKRRQEPAQADANLSDEDSSRAGVPKLSVTHQKAAGEPSFMPNASGSQKDGEQTILLIEQNAFSFIAIQGMLSQYQVSVDHAVSFEQGL